LASILFASASFGGGCSAGTYQQIVKNMKKNFYSIHKPPASFKFKSMSRDHPLTVEPFQISSRQEGGVAYEGSKI